ncbi:MAG: XdhC family protein [Bacteroidota bacterium]
MKELLPALDSWLIDEKPFALATVIRTWGSAPRPIGSVMAITAEMEMAGSVSGGCVEGAVVTAASEVIDNGLSKRLAYGVADEDAWSVGLSCGGKIQVFLERSMAFSAQTSEKAVWTSLVECLKSNKSCVLLTKLAEGEACHALVYPDGHSVGAEIGEALKNTALQSYKERKSQTIELESDQWFVRVFPRRSQLLIVGAAHITVDLVQLAQLFDFETLVIDPRKAFLNKTQFATPPDKLFDQYPDDVLPNLDLDEYTYAAVLSHDPKIDDPALQTLLRSNVAYIGGLGSRKTQAKRRARLEASGFTEAEIDRIHAPIGVDINAKKPREIALSILSEIIKVQNAHL